MKLKIQTYYKRYYTYSISDYDIMYTGKKYVYIIAEKAHDKPLDKFDKKLKWENIKKCQYIINKFNLKIEELSKEDVFLELL